MHTCVQLRQYSLKLLGRFKSKFLYYFSLSYINIAIIPALYSQLLFKVQMLFYFSWKSRVPL